METLGNGVEKNVRGCYELRTEGCCSERLIQALWLVTYQTHEAFTVLIASRLHNERLFGMVQECVQSLLYFSNTKPTKHMIIPVCLCTLATCQTPHLGNKSTIVIS